MSGRCRFGRPHVWVTIHREGDRRGDLLECAECEAVDCDGCGAHLPPGTTLCPSCDFTVGVAGPCDRCGLQTVLQAGERDYLGEATEHICRRCSLDPT